MNVERFQKCDDFHVLKFNDHLKDIPFQTESRKCDFFQIFFSDYYDVEVTIDAKTFSLKDKTLISFLAPQQTLSVDVKSVEKLSNGYMMAFQSSFLKNGKSNFEIEQKFPYFNKNYSPIYFINPKKTVFPDIIRKIYDLFQELSDENLEIIRSYLNILLLEAKKSFYDGNIKTSLASRSEQISFSFESLVKKYSNKRKPLDFYAEKLNISTVYLSECVKKTTGKTAKKIIKEYVILEASTLLIQSLKTIDEISDSLGFSATSNFSNFFKKETGCTPLEFKNQNT